MNYFIQPENELILAVLLEDDDHAALRTFLSEQSEIEDVRESGMAFDHAFDPHKVLEAVRYAHFNLRLGHVVMELGKTAATATVSAAVKAWVDRRNERKQKAIEAKEAEPLLFDQFGHRLDIRPESKKRKR